MKFSFAIRVLPPAPFGLPEEGMTVLPAGPRQLASPMVHTRAMQLFSHGTLSEYRKDSEQLKASLELAGVHAEIQDNFWMVSAESGSKEEARQKVVSVLDRWMHYLSTAIGRTFSYEELFIESENEQVHRRPKLTQVPMLAVTMYNLGEMRSRVEEGFAVAVRPDPRLDKAYTYIGIALQLRDEATRLALLTPSVAILWGMAFLQLWKAITVIVGDPKLDSDHQRRHRTYGLPHDFWKTDLDPLYRVRGEADVAHYRLEQGVSGAKASFGKALTVARRVLRAYEAHQQDAGNAPTAGFSAPE